MAMSHITFLFSIWNAFHILLKNKKEFHFLIFHYILFGISVNTFYFLFYFLYTLYNFHKFDLCIFITLKLFSLFSFQHQAKLVYYYTLFHPAYLLIVLLILSPVFQSAEQLLLVLVPQLL